MTVSIRHIDHVVLYVSDIERSIRFYGEVLGCPVAKRIPGRDLVHLRAGTAMLDLLPLKDAPAGRNMDHVAFRIDPFDGEALVAHLAAHGITPGQIVQRYGAEGDGPSLYFDDPDGNTIELKGPPNA